MAEWLMAADCKSATLRVTEVRILPCAPFIFVLFFAGSLFARLVVRTGEWSGSEPGRQRTDGNCAGCTGIIGDSSLADNGAREVSVADLDPVRIFCLPRPTRTAAFAVGL